MNALTNLLILLQDPDAVLRFLETMRALGVPTIGA